MGLKRFMSIKNFEKRRNKKSSSGIDKLNQKFDIIQFTDGFFSELPFFAQIDHALRESNIQNEMSQPSRNNSGAVLPIRKPSSRARISNYSQVLGYGLSSRLQENI